MGAQRTLLSCRFKLEGTDLRETYEGTECVRTRQLSYEMGTEFDEWGFPE